MKKIIGIDPGSEKSGVVVLENGAIKETYEAMPNESVVEFLLLSDNLSDMKVIIEDVRAYNMRISGDIIETVKFIGWLTGTKTVKGKLSELGIKYELIPRYQVKEWIFLQFRTMAEPEIIKIIARNQARNEKKAIEAGEEYKKRNLAPTFIYVEDRIVANAMRKWWDIKKPSRPGQKSPYGLKTHSWQSLALCSYWMATMGLKINNLGSGQ